MRLTNFHITNKIEQKINKKLFDIRVINVDPIVSNLPPKKEGRLYLKKKKKKPITRFSFSLFHLPY
jgi:hypothetical protein